MSCLSRFGFSLQWFLSSRRLPVRTWVDASFLLKERRFKDAAEKFEKGLIRNPTHPSAAQVRLNLSFCYSKLGRYKEALEHLRHAVLKNPRFEKAVIRLARMELWLCRPKDAAMTVRNALDFIRPSPELAALYLTACMDGSIDGPVLREARELARFEQSRHPTHRSLAVAIARYEWMENRTHEAKACLETVCELTKNCMEALLALGELLLSDGNVGGSRQLLNHALSLSPNHPRVQALLAVSYLLDSPYYSPDYAIQLATNSCRLTLWEDVVSMEVLHEAYSKAGRQSEASLVKSRIRTVRGENTDEPESPPPDMDLAA